MELWRIWPSLFCQTGRRYCSKNFTDFALKCTHDFVCNSVWAASWLGAHEWQVSQLAHAEHSVPACPCWAQCPGLPMLSTVSRLAHAEHSVPACPCWAQCSGLPMLSTVLLSYWAWRVPDHVSWGKDQRGWRKQCVQHPSLKNPHGKWADRLVGKASSLYLRRFEVLKSLRHYLQAIINQVNNETVANATLGWLLKDVVEHMWGFLSVYVQSWTELIVV